MGAILTQNTAWTNVEKAIKALKRAGLLNPASMHAASRDDLAGLIRSAGYFNVKAGRLKNFLDHLFDTCDGKLTRLLNKDSVRLRAELLSINGIGPETADSILLYAALKPVFVIDAYTKRILSRHGLCSTETSYHDLQTIFTTALNPQTELYNEYHALIVKTGKDYCKTRQPLCDQCPLGGFLTTGEGL